MKKWEQESAKTLKPNQVAAITKLIKSLDKNEVEVNSVIEQVIKLNERVKTMRPKHAGLDQAIKQLSAKEPNWAKFGEVFIKLLVGAGYIVTGTSVIPGPDPAECLKVANKIAEVTGALSGTVGTLKELYEGAAELVA